MRKVETEEEKEEAQEEEGEGGEDQRSQELRERWQRWTDRARGQRQLVMWGTPDNRRGGQRFRQLGCNVGKSVRVRRQSCAGSC